MYRQTALVAFALTVSAAAQAQVVLSTGDNSAAARPALISSTSIQNADSPLVAAAKRTVAARQKSGPVKTYVIDNRTVRLSTKTLTTASNQAPLPDYTNAYTPPAPQQASEPEVDRQALQQRAAQLQQELQRRMQDEEQGPYGEGNEDRNAQRMTEGTRELNDTNSQLNQAPPPPPPQQ